jgi:mono/diheme cytochrome c family protein
MSKPGIVVSALAALLIGGTVASFAIAWRPAIAAIDPPAPQSFGRALVKRGRDLAAVGNCADCHTVRGGKSFARGSSDVDAVRHDLLLEYYPGC